MTAAGCHPLIDSWHLAADGAAAAARRPAGGGCGGGSEPQPFHNRKALAPPKADPFVLINPRNEFSHSLATCGAAALMVSERPGEGENAKRWKGPPARFSTDAGDVGGEAGGRANKG